MDFRRRLLLRRLAAGLAFAGLPAAGSCADLEVAALPRFRPRSYPFALGVASGSPASDGVVIWTRIAWEPLDGEPLPAQPIPVRWQVADDAAFARIVRQGRSVADPAFAHAVHVEVDGLAPARWYWYRFLAGGEESPVGRTRTAPADDQDLGRLRFAFASCQHYEQGWFVAYRHMADEGLDLVAFLGDYLYESSWGSRHVRKHLGGVPRTLEGYRLRHAQYKTDPDLARMHAQVPWLLTWDDHEVENDYADDRDVALDPQFLARRAAAYRAYYEHMPMRRSSLPDGPSMRIWGRSGFGSLAEFLVLDDRQFRSHQACQRPARGGGSVVDGCAERFDPARTLLGREQQGWLLDALSGSRARWKILAQQTLMAQLDRRPGPGRAFWTDGWDGYPLERARILGHVLDRGIDNVVVIGGDMHSNWVCDLKPDFDDPNSPVVGTEFCGTSITSQGSGQPRADALLADNPHVRFVNTERRGYAVVEVTGKRLTTTLRVVDDEKRKDSGIASLARFEVESGRAGARRIDTV